MVKCDTGDSMVKVKFRGDIAVLYKWGCLKQLHHLCDYTWYQGHRIAVQSRKAVTAYLLRKQLLPFDFAKHCGLNHEPHLTGQSEILDTCPMTGGISRHVGVKLPINIRHLVVAVTSR